MATKKKAKKKTSKKH